MRIAVALAILAVTACGNSGSSATKTGPAGGSVTIRLTGDWTTFDPQGPPNGNSFGLISGVYDRLVSMDAGSKIVPYLATKWTATPTTLTFTLRKDVTCSDGSALTASTVAKSFQRLINLKFASLLWGPGPYTVASDDAAGTFTLTLGTPWSDALASFSNSQASFVCPAAIAGNPVTTPVGSGLYTLTSAVHGDSYVLKKRSGWNWGPDGINSNSPGLADTITYKVVASDTTAANLLLTGGLDFAQVTGPDLPRLTTSKGIIHQVGTGPYSYTMMINELPGHPGADEKVREALMTALDRSRFIQAAFGGFSHTDVSFLAPVTACYDATVAKYIPKPDVSAAKQILLGAGYTAGSDGMLQKGGKPLVVNLVSPASIFGKGAEYEISVWNQAGITVTYADLDYATVGTYARTGKFDVLNLNVATSNPATGSLIGYLAGPTPEQGGTNYARTIDPQMASDVQSAEGATGAASCKFWAQVQARMLTQHHTFPLGTAEVQFFGNHIQVDPATYLGSTFPTINLRRTA